MNSDPRYVFSAPETMLDSIPGTLMLTDCLEQCQSNDSCSSVNYETGLCILFSSNADKLPGKLTHDQAAFQFEHPNAEIQVAQECFTVTWCWSVLRKHASSHTKSLENYINGLAEHQDAYNGRQRERKVKLLHFHLSKGKRWLPGESL